MLSFLYLRMSLLFLQMKQPLSLGTPRHVSTVATSGQTTHWLQKKAFHDFFVLLERSLQHDEGVHFIYTHAAFPPRGPLGQNQRKKLNILCYPFKMCACFPMPLSSAFSCLCVALHEQSPLTEHDMEWSRDIT